MLATQEGDGERERGCVRATRGWARHRERARASESGDLRRNNGRERGREGVCEREGGG